MELRVWGGRSVSYLFPEEGQRVFRLFLFLFFSLLRAGSHPDNLKQKGPVCPCDVHWRSSRELHPPPSSAPFTYYTTSLLDGDTASSSSSSSFSLRAALLQIQIQVPLLSRGFPRRAQRGTLREKKKKRSCPGAEKLKSPPSRKRSPPSPSLSSHWTPRSSSSSSSFSSSSRRPTRGAQISSKRHQNIWRFRAGGPTAANESCDICNRSGHDIAGSKKKKKKCWSCVCVCVREREKEKERDGCEKDLFLFPPPPSTIEVNLCADYRHRWFFLIIISFTPGRSSLSRVMSGFFFFLWFPKIKILWEYKLPSQQLA